MIIQGNSSNVLNISNGKIGGVQMIFRAVANVNPLTQLLNFIGCTIKLELKRQNKSYTIINDNLQNLAADALYEKGAETAFTLKGTPIRESGVGSTTISLKVNVLLPEVLGLVSGDNLTLTVTNNGVYPSTYTGTNTCDFDFIQASGTPSKGIPVIECVNIQPGTSNQTVGCGDQVKKVTFINLDKGWGDSAGAWNYTQFLFPTDANNVVSTANLSTSMVHFNDTQDRFVNRPLQLFETAADAAMRGQSARWVFKSPQNNVNLMLTFVAANVTSSNNVVVIHKIQPCPIAAAASAAVTVRKLNNITATVNKHVNNNRRG